MNELDALLSDLVSIDSVNPDLVPGARGGRPTVVPGPRGEGLHGGDEWADLASVRACHDVISGTIDEFCR
jgi:hypothetical protein